MKNYQFTFIVALQLLLIANTINHTVFKNICYLVAVCFFLLSISYIFKK